MRIALIAHDGKKPEMVAFIMQNRAVIRASQFCMPRELPEATLKLPV